MPNAAFLLAPVVPVPEFLPDEPRRTTPHDEAIDDHDPSRDEGSWPEEADYPDPFGHQPPRNAALRPMLAYRGITFKPVRRAQGIAFLAHSAKPDAFDLGRQRGDELTRLYDIAHAYGGDHLVLWTFGQAVHLWAARAVVPGARPRVLQLSVRIDAPNDVGRPVGTAERIAHWLEGSPLTPDLAALRRALMAPTPSVPALFAAFGVPGAKDVQPPDVGAGWDAFELAAGALLRGDAPDAAARKQVNALIDDADAQLPGNPAAKRGATARRVATAFAALREVLGESASGRLAACASAADLNDRITSGPAGDGLLQSTRGPLAEPRAVGRLLAHYSPEVRRDPIFLALVALQAEVWNGHAFVAPLFELAEHADDEVFALADGFPDVLASDALAEDAHRTDRDEPPVPRAALAARLDAGGASPVASLLDHPWPQRDEALSMLVRLATGDESYATALERDLRAVQEAGARPRVSRSGTELWVHTAKMAMHVRRIARMLGDLPAGSTVALAHGESLALLRIDPELAKTQPPVAAPAPSPDWVPPQVVLELNDHVYATADLARLAWRRDDGLRIARQLATRYPGRVSAEGPIAATDALALHDDALLARGFARLGDLVATHLPGFAVRAYTHRDGVSMAIVVVAPTRPLVECEIQSLLADGSEIITSSLDLGVPARPGASVRRAPLGVDDLWQAHERHLAEVRGGRSLHPAPATLADFVRLLER